MCSITQQTFTTEPGTDYRRFEIHSLAASAAIATIKDFIASEHNSDLQHLSLISYLKQFNFETLPIESLLSIRKFVLSNFLYIDSRYDNLRCFLRLMLCDGIPVSIDFTTSIKFINFTHFIISITNSSFNINITYSKLKLILAGDVESNPGPPTHSTVYNADKDKTQRKIVLEMQKEIAKLKKAAERQQCHIQRQIELEKRNRSKLRKSGADRKRHAQGLLSAFDNAGQAIEDCAKGIGPTLSMVQEALQQVISMGDSLKTLFSIPAEVDVFGVLVSLASLASAIANRSVLLLAMHCTNLARLLGVTFSSIFNLLPKTEDSEPISPEVEQGVYYRAESVDDDIPARVSQSLVSDMLSTAAGSTHLLPVTGFLAFLSGIFTLLCTNKMPTATNMTQHFTLIGRASNGFRSVRDMFSWITNYISEIYYCSVYGMTTEQYGLIKEYPKLEEIYAASEIVKDLTKTQIDSSAAIANQVVALSKELKDYVCKAMRCRSIAISGMAHSLEKKMADQITWAVNSPARHHNIRAEPVSLYLYGKPGTGKSVMTEVISAKLFKKFFAAKGTLYSSSSYVRKAVNKFWDGYVNQPLVILDDFANSRDSIANPIVEYEELINMVNTCQYPLNMASIGDKSCTFFDSDFIIASSNQQVPDIKSKVDPGAVYRRFHMWAEVKISPNYGSRVGTSDDPQGRSYFKYDSEVAKRFVQDSTTLVWDEDNPLRTEHYRITLYRVDPKTPTVTTPLLGCSDLTFDEFWEKYLQMIEIRGRSARSLQTAIRKMAGIDAPAEPETEKEIMDKFKVIFNPEDLLDAVCVAPEVKSDDKSEEFKDAWDEWDLFEQNNTYGSKIRTAFKDAVSVAHTRFGTMTQRLVKAASSIKNKFISLAEFLLSLISSISGKVNPYLPILSTSQYIVGLGASMLAFFSITWAVLFRKVSPKSWCEFALSPSASCTPCTQCPACRIIDYPSHGNMLDHFLKQASVRQVRKELVGSGADSDALTSLVESLWSEKCASAESRVYANEPTIARSRNFAQGEDCETYAESRVYDNQPRAMKMNRFANSQAGNLIDAKTDIHIGSTIFAQRDRVRIEQTTQVLLQNSVWIQAVDADGMASRSNGVFLVGRTMVTTAHTVLNPPKSSPIVQIMLYNPYTDVPSIAVPIADCQISQMKQMDGTLIDLALVSFPPCVPNRPRILNKFISSYDLDALTEGQLVFSGFYQVKGKTIVQEKHPSSFKVSTKTTQYNQHEDGHCPISDLKCACDPIRIGNHIEYDIETMKGMCGALLSVNNKLVHTKLIGFHVAGGSGVDGLGALTTRQLLDASLADHVAKFDIPQRYLVDGRLPYSQSWLDPSLAAKLNLSGDCIGLGVAISPAAPIHTQLQESAVFDCVQEHFTKPAHLSKFHNGETVIDPMHKGILKVLGPQVYIDNDMLDAALNDVFDTIGSGAPRVLSYEESITGVEGDSYMRPINRRTSPGYPYNLNNNSKGKTHWLGNGVEYDLENVELRRDVDKLIDDSANYIRGDAISIATLKDEKRPIAKVDAGKTRVFEACPQHLVLAIRRYYLSFVAHVMRNRIDNEICVGINPYSLEWTKLAHHLQSQGNNIIAGDFSNFDGSLSLQIVYKIAERINEWYGDDSRSQAIRSTLWEHICNADVLVRGDVIRQTHSQPSGNPLTVIVNSIFNSVVMRLAYMKLKQGEGLSPKCDFRKYVANANYGDDNVLSIHRSILPWYNQISITSALADFGLTYTDEAKSGELVTCRDLESVAFLKRSFSLQLDGTFLAPMDLVNSLEITNWIRGKAIKAATRDNCECSIMELSLQPKHTYDKWSRKIRDECDRKNIQVTRPTYWEWQEDYRVNRDMYDSQIYTPLW